MNKSIFSAASATVFLSLFLMPPSARSQDATGKIAGNVTDASGAVVSGANIVVTNLDTKTVKETQTDKQGFYQVQQLPIGRYEVTAEASGFSRSLAKPASALEINQDPASRSDLAGGRDNRRNHRGQFRGRSRDSEFHGRRHRDRASDLRTSPQWPQHSRSARDTARRDSHQSGFRRRGLV